MDHERIAPSLNSFVSFSGEASLHFYPEYSVLNTRTSDSRHAHLFMNQTATDILESCNGRTQLNAVVRSFSEKYRAPVEKVTGSVMRIVNEGLEKTSLEAYASPTDRPVKITGSKDYWIPQQVSIEITSRCNERCLHCYGRFDKRRRESYDEETLRSILEHLIQRGMVALTITGGEPFMHKKTMEIIEWVLPKVEALGIISNGTLLPREIFPILTRNNYKMAFQVSLNGRREYHDRFTGLRGSFDKILRNIELLVDTGVKLRVGMNTNEDNYGDIQYVAGVMSDLKVPVFTVNGPHNVGREVSRRVSSPFFRDRDPDRNLDLLRIISDEIKKARERYPEIFRSSRDFKSVMSIGRADPITEITDFPATFSCGAGQRSVHIDASGNVRICPIAGACNFPPLGNILEQSIDDIMASDFSRNVARTYSPSLDHCGRDCENFVFCGGCIAKGYSKYTEMKESCLWGSTLFGKFSEEN